MSSRKATWILRGAIVLILAVSLTGTGCVWWWTSVAEGEPVADARVSEETKKAIEADVRFLSKAPRSEESPDHYDESANYISSSLQAMGWDVHSENVPGVNRSFENLWVELPGEDETIVIVGAHYDSAYSTPGADDNASGTAIALEMARRFHGKKPKHRLVIAFFANEEPPYFRTVKMGSHVMATRYADQGADICAMISLEMLGYFTDEPQSQKYPPVLSWFYPDVGNFVGFVTDIDGRKLVRKSTAAFHKNSTLEAYGFAGPKTIQGIDYSDHMPFWSAGFRAMMITDTSFFRNPHYHKPTDTADTLNFDAMVQVAGGVESVVELLAFSDACRSFN